MLVRRIPTALLRFSRANSSSVPTPAAAASATLPATAAQAPNHAAVWSHNQRPRPASGSSPRFEQIAMELQPNPLSAMQLISEQPVIMVHGRKAVCDGGGGPLGHPKIYINLDKEGSRPCGYCGLRYEQEPHHHH